MAITISVVIPAYNSAGHLQRSLKALVSSTVKPCEVVVVNDGSTDETATIAESFGVRVLTIAGPKGPAVARNLGASVTTGNIILFVDADVCVAPDTLDRLLKIFEIDSTVSAVIGAYDSFPSAPDFLSQYRNLMHAFVHGSHARMVTTFWSGCGAIRREVFLSHGGFSEGYRQPAVEDIELGYRLSRSGCRIYLDPEIQVTHLKRWTLTGLLKTDIFYRGIPWTELILRDRTMPNDLNLEVGQRVSVFMMTLLALLTAITVVQSGPGFLLPLLTVTLLMLAGWWSEPAFYLKPRVAFLILPVLFAVLVSLLVASHMELLLLPLALMPVGLMIRKRYGGGRLRWWLQLAGMIYFGCTAFLAVYEMPLPPYQVAIGLIIVAITVALNFRFYQFLSIRRGVLFTLATIPFHFLYHFYNCFSFMAGVIVYLGYRLPGTGKQIDGAVISK
jgi:GT2 family glycosyltransferase